jgi:hypothetical protein
LQLRAFVTRAWCGPGGLHSGRKARTSGWGSRRGLEKPRVGSPLMDSSFSVGFAIQAPAPFPGVGEHGGARFFVTHWPGWLAGFCWLCSLAGCCCRLVVVVVVVGCLLVLAGCGRGNDGGRTGDATCACEAGDEWVAVVCLAVRVVVPFLTSVCACRGSLPRSVPPWRGFAFGPPASMEPRGRRERHPFVRRGRGREPDG